ncbi:MAG TPA: EamA family transporter [Hydrogenispora sp.]|jgi:drug/metabolite transporter (DMT)-like permease|nr:EamA family transporter [Hydrogenispora sp.]
MIRAYIVAVLTEFIFGFSFIFTKGALDHITPHQLLAFRFITAALVLTLLRALRVIKIDLKNRPLGRVLLLALFQPVLYFILETTGINLTTASEAGLMIALIPVFVTLLAALFLKEIPSPLQAASILTSVFGVGFIVLGGGRLSTSGHTLGLVALLGAVLSAAIFTILSRWLSQQFRPVELTFVMMWAGAIFFGGLAFFEAQNRLTPTPILALLQQREVWTAVLYLGLLSSVVAFFGMNYFIAKIGAARSAVFANLSTIVSVAAGIGLRGEPFHWYHLVGGVLILLGVAGTNRFRPRAQS